MPSWAAGFVLEWALLAVLVWVGVAAEVMSDVKCWIDACNLGLEDSVTSGIQRKCVSGGLGGMVGSQLRESVRTGMLFLRSRNLVVDF